VSLIDTFVVIGVGLVVPLALGGPVAGWLAVGVCVGCSFLLEEGALAGVLVLPLVLLALAMTAKTVQQRGPLLFWSRLDVVHVAACGWVLVAAGSLVVSRIGLTPFGLREPIIELTAVHYLYAGVAALVLAGWTHRSLPVVLTAVAPPIIAVGFLTEHPIPQVGGAVVLTLGVYATATLQLRDALERARPVSQRSLLVLSGLSVWAPMVLALAWASGQHWRIPVLSIPDMARTHGAANALGFVICGLLARRPERRARELAARLERAATAPLTYEGVGVTLTEECTDRTTRVLGRGREVFDEAVRRLETWAPQTNLGATVLPTGVEPRPGVTILVDLKLGPIAIAVPNRIVAVVDEPDRWGFAYGTLRGHHECGEESFVVRHHPDDTVTACIAVDAGPASIPARAAAPIVRRLQRIAIRRYLDTLA
jgi:uncharacterized protein (UPF0548 family)